MCWMRYLFYVLRYRANGRDREHELDDIDGCGTKKSRDELGLEERGLELVGKSFGRLVRGVEVGASACARGSE